MEDKRIKKYKKNNGDTAYMFNIYLGKNPLTGKDKRVTRRGFVSRREARLAIARLESGMENIFQPTDHPTFEAVYLKWFELYKNTVKESSWSNTEKLFRLHILPKIGAYKIELLTPTILQDTVNDWFNGNYKRYNIPFVYTRKVFNYAYRLDLIETNPIDKVIVPKKTNELRKSITNYFNREELLIFFEALDQCSNPVEANLFKVLAMTGMRTGEARALLWDDINLDDSSISINKTAASGVDGRVIIQSPKTAHGERVIELDKTTALILKKWKVQQREWLFLNGQHPKKKQLVFTNTCNEYINRAMPTKWMVSMINSIRITHPDFKKITVHGLRHTYATLAFEGGAEIKEVQEQLGHSNYQTTMDIYTAVTKGNKKAASEKLANFIFG